MPRSVIVLSEDPDLLVKLRAWLRDDKRFTDTEDGLHCDGTSAPLTDIFPVENPAYEWEDWDEDVTGVANPQAMTALIFECSSPNWVAEVGTLISLSTEGPVWFVDAAGVAWAADRVDTRKVALG